MDDNRPDRASNRTEGPGEAGGTPRPRAHACPTACAVGSEGGDSPGEPRPGPALRVAAAPLIACVLLYRATLAPLMGGRCRFHPSCSEYALIALRRHGPFRGGWLAVKRVLRCHPLGGSGYDPPPV